MDFFEAVGSSKFWNLSPCEDLLGDEATVSRVLKQEGKTINILIAGVGDVFHLLKTLAMFRRKQQLTGYKLHVRGGECDALILCSINYYCY